MRLSWCKGAEDCHLHQNFHVGINTFAASFNGRRGIQSANNSAKSLSFRTTVTSRFKSDYLCGSM